MNDQSTEDTPLSGSDDDTLYDNGAKMPNERPIVSNDPVVAVSTSIEPKVPKRRHLPDRRRGYNQRFRVGGQTVYLRTGEYEDGTLGEIFIDVNKTGTMVRALCSGIAMTVSRALQYGVPLCEFIDAFKDYKFEPSGDVEGHHEIKEASSILDCIFRDLEAHYMRKRWTPPPERHLHLGYRGGNVG